MGLGTQLRGDGRQLQLWKLGCHHSLSWGVQSSCLEFACFTCNHGRANHWILELLNGIGLRWPFPPTHFSLSFSVAAFLGMPFFIRFFFQIDSTGHRCLQSTLSSKPVFFGRGGLWRDGPVRKILAFSWPGFILWHPIISWILPGVISESTTNSKSWGLPVGDSICCTIAPVPARAFLVVGPSCWLYCILPELMSSVDAFKNK